MANKTIYLNGSLDVTVPATESIAISNFGGGIAKIYYLIEDANRPAAWQFQQTLENSSVVLGAFTNETIVRIEANNSNVVYDIGTAPDTGIGNADTVGGLAPTQFVRSDVDDDVAGVLTFTSTDAYPVTIDSATNTKILLTGSTDPLIRFQEGTTNKCYIQWHSDGYFQIINSEDSSYIRIADNFILSGSTLQLPVLAADPGTGVAGQIYYNTTSNLVRFYNGSAWGDI